MSVVSKWKGKESSGKYGLLNGNADVSYFRFILPYTTHYHKFTTHQKNIMVLKVIKIIVGEVRL